MRSVHLPELTANSRITMRNKNTANASLRISLTQTERLPLRGSAHGVGLAKSQNRETARILDFFGNTSSEKARFFNNWNMDAIPCLKRFSISRSPAGGQV